MKTSETLRTNDAEEQYLRRYQRCRQLMENDGRFGCMSDEEKDTYAQRLATPEYLDLTCDWACKYLFQNHPNLLVTLLNDILREDIKTVEFQNTELADIAPLDKKILFDLLCKTSNGRSFLVEMQRASRTDQRDRLFYYGARLVGRLVKPGEKKYTLAPVKVICIMNYEDKHPDSSDDKILYQYKTLEIETGEPFGDQISFYLLELPRIMHYSEEYDSPVAAWCRIFRNFAIFAKSRDRDDARFKELESAMRVSGLNEGQIDNYFSDMLTMEEMEPYIEGAEQQGYYRGLKEGESKGKAEGLAEGLAEGISMVAKALLAGGMTSEEVAKVTGMSAEDIDRLKSDSE